MNFSELKPKEKELLKSFIDYIIKNHSIKVHIFSSNVNYKVINFDSFENLKTKLV